MGVNVGIMGKHPGFGDFLCHGLSEQTRSGLDSWITNSLAPIKDQAGEGWEAAWDNAPMLRFWVGRALAGRTIAGIFMPSRDRVGRRFPLILIAEGVDLAPPVIDPSQDLYKTLEAHLLSIQPGSEAKSLLDGFDASVLPVQSETAETQSEGPLIWAHHPEGDLDALLSAARSVDHMRATTTRSYWWSPPRAGQHAAIWLAHSGMPDINSMGWLLAGKPQGGADQQAGEVEGV